jgi:hypothetical protein
MAQLRLRESGRSRGCSVQDIGDSGLLEALCLRAGVELIRIDSVYTSDHRDGDIRSAARLECACRRSGHDGSSRTQFDWTVTLGRDDNPGPKNEDRINALQAQAPQAAATTP